MDSIDGDGRDWMAEFERVVKGIRDLAAAGRLGPGIAYDPARDEHRHELASRPQRDFTRPPANT